LIELNERADPVEPQRTVGHYRPVYKRALRCTHRVGNSSPGKGIVVERFYLDRRHAALCLPWRSTEDQPRAEHELDDKNKDYAAPRVHSRSLSTPTGADQHERRRRYTRPTRHAR